MHQGPSGWGAWIRTWLILGRVSNLPTVWSNCLAAWLLGGGGSGSRLVVLSVGATAVYLGGMFLNDAVDAGFDREHRRERPIPAGAVAAATVWKAAVGLVAGGVLVMGTLGGATLALAVLLGGAVVLYDLVHKRTPLAPGIMGLCRCLLYLVAASAAEDGVTGQVVWSGLALGAYVVGLSQVARVESIEGARGVVWPMLGLVWPLLLAVLMNPMESWGYGQVAMPAVWLGLVIGHSLSHLLRGAADGARRTVSGLLAGIVVVDAVAVMPPAAPWGLTFVGLWALARLLQARVPAT